MAGYHRGPFRGYPEDIDDDVQDPLIGYTPPALRSDDPWGHGADRKLDYDKWGAPRSRKKLKRELAADIGQLILDITGIFDPTPVSDGTNALISLARGRWLDALVSTVSIVPYVGDVSKVAKMPGYLKSIRLAIRLARLDFFWKTQLRDVFFPLRKLLDKALALGTDQLPDVTRQYLDQMRYEIDEFLPPESMSALKPKPQGEVEHVVPGRGPSRKARSPKKGKAESGTSDDAFREQSQDSSIGEDKIGVKSSTPDTNIVSNKLTNAQRIDKLDIEGHAPIRHGGPNRVTDLQLEDRAVRGIDPASGTTYDAFNKFPNGSPKPHKVGKNATAFTSDEALLRADDFARSSTQFQQNVATARANGDLFVDAVELPLKDVFGSGYKNSVRGVTRLGSKNNPTGHTAIDFTDGMIKAIYRLDQNGNIKLHTLYPNPKP